MVFFFYYSNYLYIVDFYIWYIYSSIFFFKNIIEIIRNIQIENKKNFVIFILYIN